MCARFARWNLLFNFFFFIQWFVHDSISRQQFSSRLWHSLSTNMYTYMYVSMYENFIGHTLSVFFTLSFHATYTFIYTYSIYIYHKIACAVSRSWCATTRLVNCPSHCYTAVIINANIFFIHIIISIKSIITTFNIKVYLTRRYNVHNKYI